MTKKEMNIAVNSNQMTKADVVRWLASGTHNGFVTEIQHNLPVQLRMKPSQIKRILARSGYNVSNRSDLYISPSFYKPKA